ncbi:hypothetical protein FHR67_004365 [Xanthomonas arboricola]|nr:hypothetical protein [Xanthomonas campestris]
MDSQPAPPTKLFIGVAAASILAVVGLAALGLAQDFGDLLFVALCVVVVAVQLGTGYPISRTVLPGPHRRVDPLGFLFAVGLPSLAAVIAMVLALARRGVLLIGA